MSLGEAIAYIISQLVAAAGAALLLRAVLGGVATGLDRPELAQNVVLGATTLTITPAAGFVIEAVLAFFLVIVVLTTAVARSAGNFAPIAIGMTVALNIMMAGSLTGPNFNPAISLGPMIATDNFTDAWLYVTAPIAGAIAAALIHKVQELLAEDGTLTAQAPRPRRNDHPKAVVRRRDSARQIAKGEGKDHNRQAVGEGNRGDLVGAGACPDHGRCPSADEHESADELRKKPGGRVVLHFGLRTKQFGHLALSASWRLGGGELADELIVGRQSRATGPSGQGALAR